MNEYFSALDLFDGRENILNDLHSVNTYLLERS